MKFKNFVKSLASSGVIYKRGIEDLPFVAVSYTHLTLPTNSLV